MAEGDGWEIPEGGHDDEDRGDDTDERTTLFPREGDGDWTKGRGRPSSHKSPSRHQYETGKGTASSHVNPSFEVEEGGGLNESIIEFRSERQDEAKRRIQEKYPDWDPSKSKFVATIVDNKVTVSLTEGGRIGSKPYVLFKEDGTLRSSLPKAIVKDLGKTTFKIIDERDVRIDELRRTKN